MILNLLERHRDKWVEDGECYRWIAAVNNANRPMVGWNGKVQLVSRILCEEAHGLPPLDKPLALHDTPNGCIGDRCVNGEHLRWGDKRDNAMDEPAERRREWSRRGYETKTPESRTRMRGAKWAAKEAGEKIYFTDKPCKRGHTGPRRVVGGCIECVNLRNSWRKGR